MKITACQLAGFIGVFVPAAAFGAATVDVEKKEAAAIAKDPRKGTAS